MSVQRAKGGIIEIEILSRSHAAAYRSRSDLARPTDVVRFTILGPTCQRQLVTSLRSPAAWFASVVFAEAFASRGVGAILTVVNPAELANSGKMSMPGRSQTIPTPPLSGSLSSAYLVLTQQDCNESVSR